MQNSSVLGLVALRYRGAYIASKFAIEALTDTMRLELHGSGVHVCLIEPGPIVSRFRANAFAAFKRNIDVESSPHREVYRDVVKRLADEDEEAPFTLPGIGGGREAAARAGEPAAEGALLRDGSHLRARVPQTGAPRSLARRGAAQDLRHREPVTDGGPV